MAVHCGVCGRQIGSAPNNFGSFSVTEDFKGWDRRGRSPRIDDTCEVCHGVLAKAVTDAANRIAQLNKARVDVLRFDQERQADREAKDQKDRADFEREWEARRRSGR